MDINIKAGISWVGKTYGILTPDVQIPETILIPGQTLMAVPGPQAQILRLLEVNDLDAGGKQLVFSNLVDTGRRVYTLGELANIRPLGFIVPDRPWVEYGKFVEGGIYQAVPNGRVFRVRNRHLVDGFQGVRAYNAKDKEQLPSVLSIFIPRYVPRVVAGQGVPAGDEA